MSTIINENIGDVLRSRIADFHTAPIVYHKGYVASAGDGVVRIKGLPGRLYGELLEFEGGAYGMALDLEEDGVGAVLLDPADAVGVGTAVKGTGAVAEIPVGQSLIGRVIDAVGRPLDGEPLEAKEYFPCEAPAPTIMERRPVDRPLETGILAIDSMVPIGRGQRELIIGDRQTGKTSIALDAVINQKPGDVLCIYCAIGQKASSVAGIIKSLKTAGAMERCIVVAATASDSPAMQYLAPYAACAVAESFMKKGRDVLVVYDDLSKHAVAYRTMSLLLHRPPGREAYPGDVFYLHSRLLERSACLSRELGGGSITALPIIETTGGNISAYIPTNVISITDGQIYLETELFHSGVRPAVNTGLSVSRVGRAAQAPAMRAVSGSLRIELSQYREMAVFTRFGSDVDESTKKMLERGHLLTELLKQPKGKPYSLFDEAAVLLAYRNGIFDGLPDKETGGFVREMLEYLGEKAADEKNTVNSGGELSDSTAKRIIEVMSLFTASCKKDLSNGKHQ